MKFKKSLEEELKIRKMPIIATIAEKEVNLMIMSYLKERGYIDSLLTFEKETHQYLTNYKKQPLFLKQLLISGKFKQAESYLECLLGETERLKISQFLIKKQYFLELITKKPEDKDTNRVLELLQQFENSPEIDMFEELCDLLALKKIQEKEQYRDWTILRGRELCFNSILPHVVETLGLNETEFPREFNYLRCFRGLLLSQKFDFFNEKKFKALESYEEDRGIVTKFKKIKYGEDGHGDLEDSQIIDIINESMQDDAELLNNMQSINEIKIIKNTSNFEKNQEDNRERKMLSSPRKSHETIKVKASGLRFNTVSPKIKDDYKIDDSYVENDTKKKIENSLEVKIYGYSNPQSPSDVPLNGNSMTDCNEIDREEEVSRLIPSQLMSQNVDFMTPSQITHKTIEDIHNEFNEKKQVNNFLQTDIFEAFEVTPKNELKNIYMSYQSNFASKNFTKKFSTQDEFRIIYEGNDSLPVRGAAFSADGQYLAIGSNSRVLNVYNIQNIIQSFMEPEISDSKRNLMLSRKELHDGPIYSIDYSSDNNFIASGSMDKSVKLLSLRYGCEVDGEVSISDEIFIGSHKGMVRSVKLSNDHRQLLSAGQDTNLKLWDVETQELIQKFKSSCNHTYCARFTYDHDTIIGVGADKYIQMWDKRSGKTSHMADIGNLSKMNYLSLEHNQFSDSFFNVSSISQKASWIGTKMAIGHQSGKVSLWDLRNLNNCHSTLTMHQDDCRSVEYDPSCRYILSSSFDCSTRIYDLDSETFIHTLREHEDRAVMARWHPYLPIIVTTSADCTFKVYATESFLKSCGF